jgi:uncharacterized protein YcfJ
MTHRKLLTAGIMLALLSSTAAAGNRMVYDYAKVIDAHPIYETVRVSTPRQVCRDEQVVVRSGRRDSYTSVIAGGIIGGVIGNQVIHGKYRDLGTVAGALLGGSLGNDYRYRQQAPYDQRYLTQRCREVAAVREERHLTGYQVNYRYQGREYWTTMDHDPGRRVRVLVSVDVAE